MEKKVESSLETEAVAEAITKIEKDGLTIEFDLENFQESRPDFKPLDAEQTLELLKNKPKTKKSRVRVEKDVEFLKEKETNQLFKIVIGKIPTEKERVKRDITASMLTIEPVEGGEQRLVMIGFTKDGQPSPVNKYEVIKKDKES